MTPKEKANVLHTLMYGDLDNGMTWQEAKRCALIAVDGIIKYTFDENNVDTYILREYLWDVKQEIEKL